LSLLLRPCAVLSQTTLKTVNGDFHKVKEDVFKRKVPVSWQAKAPLPGGERDDRRGLLAEVRAQGGELGAQLGDFALQASEAVLGRRQLLVPLGRRLHLGIAQCGDSLTRLASLA
jgi:hypothetical protein